MTWDFDSFRERIFVHEKYLALRTFSRKYLFSQKFSRKYTVCETRANARGNYIEKNEMFLLKIYLFSWKFTFSRKSHFRLNPIWEQHHSLLSVLFFIFHILEAEKPDFRLLVRSGLEESNFFPKKEPHLIGESFF
jgi:hypothetical protein